MCDNWRVLSVGARRSLVSRLRCSENPNGEAYAISENVPVPHPRRSKGKDKDSTVCEDELGIDFTPAAPSSSQDYVNPSFGPNGVPNITPASENVRAASAMDFTRAGAATPTLSAYSCPPPNYKAGYPKVMDGGGAEDFTSGGLTQIWHCDPALQWREQHEISLHSLHLHSWASLVVIEVATPAARVPNFRRYPDFCSLLIYEYSCHMALSYYVLALMWFCDCYLV